MAYNTDWLSGKRADQLVMAQNWVTVLREDTTNAKGETVKKYAAWGIPAATFTDFLTLFAAAQEALRTAQEKETRTEVTTAACKTAFDALVAAMRSLKDRYFKKPPLTDTDFIALGLRVKDTTPTVIAAPTAQAEADISYPGPHLLTLHLRPLAGTTLDAKADYGMSIRWGIMPHGGATLEEAAGARHYLMKPPVSGEELPHPKFTRRKKETFDLPPEDSGKTAYFCIRYENSKGQAGPFGPIVQAVIP
jgi:hypothetical protein